MTLSSKALPFLSSTILATCATIPLWSAQGPLVDTSESEYACMYMVDIDDVHWTKGFWAERWEVLQDRMVPYMWNLFQDEHESHAWANFLLAAGLDDGRDGHHHGPPFNDGDFLKWLEGLASIYAITGDPETDAQMDRIIEVLAMAQREDGYFHTQKVIPQRQGIVEEQEFEDRYHFETYNMGHLMTTACIHYRATGKDSLLKMAIKAADYLYNFYKTSSPDLARNAICPSHYMGVVELYRVTKDPRYIELAQQLIEIRDLVTDGSDHNQDRLPFREMKEAMGHAVRANYLYAGVADVYAESGDDSLLNVITNIADDVATDKLYISGMTGALYDGASPDGSKQHEAIQTVHQAYGRDYQLPNLTAYNESCATIGYAMWTWRMLTLTGDPHYADLFEQTLYNGILPAISLEGTHYFYVNPLRKLHDFKWPLRWSRTRTPNLKSSFCCPPNVIRTIAEVHNYVYSLSPDTLWVHLYADNKLDTQWQNGQRIKLRQETDYPWDGNVKLVIEEAPDQPVSLRLRIPGWIQPGLAKVNVNGKPVTDPIVPGSYLEVKGKWKAGDQISLGMEFKPVLWEANPLVEETLNQVAVKNGPLLYCLESNDLPASADIMDLAVDTQNGPPEFSSCWKEVSGSRIQMLELPALSLGRKPWSDDDLYRPINYTPSEPVSIRLIPYYAWGNRGDTEMTVWIQAK